MQSWGCSFGGKRARHAKVIDGLDCSKVQGLREVADALRKLSVLRTTADYEPEAPFSCDWRIIEGYYTKTVQAIDPAWGQLSREQRNEAVRLIQAKIKACDRG